MLGYILRRLLATIPVLVIVAVLVFLMLRLTPGDPAAIIAGDMATPAQLERIREAVEGKRRSFSGDTATGKSVRLMTGVSAALP